MRERANRKRLEEIRIKEEELQAARELAEKEKKALKLKYLQDNQKNIDQLIDEQNNKINEAESEIDENGIEREMDQAEVLQKALIENLEEKKKLENRKAEVIDVDISDLKKNNRRTPTPLVDYKKKNILDIHSPPPDIQNNKPVLDIHANIIIPNKKEEPPVIRVSSPSKRVESVLIINIYRK